MIVDHRCVHMREGKREGSLVNQTTPFAALDVLRAGDAIYPARCGGSGLVHETRGKEGGGESVYRCERLTGICSILLSAILTFYLIFLLITEKFTAIQQRIKASLILVSRSRFKVLVPYNTCVIEIFKKMPSKCYGKLIYISLLLILIILT